MHRKTHRFWPIPDAPGPPPIYHARAPKQGQSYAVACLKEGSQETFQLSTIEGGLNRFCWRNRSPFVFFGSWWFTPCFLMGTTSAGIFVDPAIFGCSLPILCYSTSYSCDLKSYFCHLISLNHASPFFCHWLSAIYIYVSE